MRNNKYLTITTQNKKLGYIAIAIKIKKKKKVIAIDLSEIKEIVDVCLEEN